MPLATSPSFADLGPWLKSSAKLGWLVDSLTVGLYSKIPIDFDQDVSGFAARLGLIVCGSRLHTRESVRCRRKKLLNFVCVSLFERPGQCA